MPRAAAPFLIGLLAAGLLAGCGNKGPLVLPDQQPQKHKHAPAQTPAKPADNPPGEPDAGH